MKIAYVMSHREQNGVTASGTAQIRALLARGHEMHLVHRPGAWIGRQRFEGNIHHYPTEMGGRFLARAEIRVARDMLKHAGVDVVYSHGTQANRVSALWRRQRAFPVLAKAAARIWHVHWRWQHGVIAPSQYTADWFIAKHLVARDRIHIVPNFVRAADIIPRTDEYRANARATLDLNDDDFVLVSVGAIDGRKNQSALVPLVAGLQDRGINAKAILIGSGANGPEAQKTRAAADAAGLGGKIHFLGHRDDARLLIPGADALVCTSRDEQGPVVVIEAMAAGLPVVSTPVGMVPTLIEPGRNGAILELAAPDAAVRYLADLAADPAHAQAQGAAGRATFKRLLSEDRIAAQLEAAFKTAIAKAGR